MKNAIEDILKERVRQVSDEGFDHSHDDKDHGGMAIVAGLYALAAGGISDESPFFKEAWPKSWAFNWWKPTNPRRNLVKAGALILAEIERIDRAAARKQ